MSQWETTVIRARHSANVVKAGHALSPKPRNLLPPTPSSNAPKSVPVSCKRFFNCNTPFLHVICPIEKTL